MEQVAVFLDFENLAIGAEETLTGRSNPVPHEALELADEPDLEERLLDAFFPGAENHGEELLPLAVALAQKRGLNR